MSVSELKKVVKEGKFIIGTEKTLKALKLGKVKKVFLSSNCPKNVKEDIIRYASLGKIEVRELDIPNDEVGVLIKKPFNISVISV